MRNEKTLLTLSRPACSLDDAAELLGLSRPTVVEAIERGDIPGQKLGRKWVIPTAPLRRMLQVEDVSASKHAGAA